MLLNQSGDKSLAVCFTAGINPYFYQLVYIESEVNFMVDIFTEPLAANNDSGLECVCLCFECLFFYRCERVLHDAGLPAIE